MTAYITASLPKEPNTKTIMNQDQQHDQNNKNGCQKSSPSLSARQAWPPGP